jgi:hypothetical protein
MNDGSTTLTASFDMSEADYREGSVLQSRLWRRVLIFTAVMLVILVGIDAYFAFVKCCRHVDFVGKMVTHIETAFVLGAAYYALLRFIMIPIMGRKRMRLNPFFFKNITIEADERGMRFRGEKTQSDWQWSDLAGYRENERLFLIYPSKSFAHIVPKRLFAGQDAERLTQLIHGKLKRL